MISEIVDKNTPFLGICLGLQLLFESSEESPGVEGLGLLKGKILRIPDGVAEDKRPLKIPHIGWNSLEFTEKKSELFKYIHDGDFVYFVHSYYLQAENEADVAATTDYVVNIHAAAEHENIFATQFHPEKSGEIGLRILKNFIEL